MNQLLKTPQPSRLAVLEARLVAGHPRLKNNEHRVVTGNAEVVLKRGSIIVNLKDADVFKKSWRINRFLYVFTTLKIARRNASVTLHRLILRRKLGRELLQREHCDHINGNRLDNRRENLRPVSRRENQRNMHNPRSKSGYFGVAQSGETWIAIIRQGKSTLWRSRFATKEEAARAYNEASKNLGFLTRNILPE